MFLTFLEGKLDHEGLEVLMNSQNIAKDTIFTLLMRTTPVSHGISAEDMSNVNSQRLLFSMIAKGSQGEDGDKFTQVGATPGAATSDPKLL